MNKPNSEKTYKVSGIKTNNGLLITDNLATDSYTSSYGRSSLGEYLVDGKTPRISFHKLWFWVDDVPQKIEQRKSQPNINYRYVLIDPSLESDKFLLELKRDDVAYYDESDYEWVWNDEYRHLYSLYSLVSDKQDDIWIDVKFEYETIMELNEIREFNGFSYPVRKTQWSSDGLIDLTQKDAQNQLIDRILFPEPVLHMMPSKLTSDQFYKVIREHVRQNINYAVAEITSDYDFCFTVKKKVKLHKPIKSEREELKANGRHYKNRRITVSYQKNRSVEIFEMTNASDCYKGYTVIPEIMGTDMDDLKVKIDTYLSDLMKMINEPLEECSHCEGFGVIGFEN